MRAIDAVNDKLRITEEEELTLNEERLEKIINAEPTNFTEGRRYMYILPQEVKNLIISFLPRQYKSKLRLQNNSPRFIYDMNITDSSEERVRSAVNLNRIDLECTIRWNPFDVVDANDHMMTQGAAPEFGLLLKKFKLLATIKRRVKRLSFSLGQEGALLSLLEAGGVCLPYLKEMEVRVSDVTLSKPQNLELTRVVEEAVRCKGSRAVLKTAILSCPLLGPFANAGLLESVESLTMTPESRGICPKHFLLPILGFSALRILDLYELHGFKFEQSLHETVHLGSVETLRVQKPALLIFSKSDKITSLGIKGSLAEGDSAEALLRGITKSFPMLRCLELVNPAIVPILRCAYIVCFLSQLQDRPMLKVLAEPSLGGMELLLYLDMLHIDGDSNLEQVIQIVAKRQNTANLKDIKNVIICGTSYDRLSVHRINDLVQHVYCLEKVDVSDLHYFSHLMKS